jgi:hypothetical protein
MSLPIKPMKLVTVLNKQLSCGTALNALGHMALGLAGRIAKSEGTESMCLIDDYVDKNGGVHPSISYYPFIVLRGGPGQIRTLRNEAIVNNIYFVDFLDTMTIGTSDEQVAKTKVTSEQDLIYYGICLFGDKAQLDLLTKKFSLWRDE